MAQAAQFSRLFTSRTSPPSNDEKEVANQRTNLAWGSSSRQTNSSQADQQQSDVTLADLASSPHFVAGSGWGAGGAVRPMRSPPVQGVSPSPPHGRWDDGVNYASDLLDPGSLHRNNLDFGVYDGVKYGVFKADGEGGTAGANGIGGDGAEATFTPPSRTSERGKRILALKENLLARSQEVRRRRGYPAHTPQHPTSKL